MSERGATPPLWDHLDAVDADLADAGGLVLCSDFDGTLAPIATDPAAPELSEERRSLLEDLADRDDVAVALVSGRSLDDLTKRTDVEGASYAGNHGVERLVDGEREVPPAAPDRGVVADAVDALRDRFADVEGVEVEDKHLSLTVHYRAADEDVEPRVLEAARAVAEAADALEVHDGKQVYEVRPRTLDKGSAVADVVDRHPDDWLAAYVGDDAGDEAAFHAVGVDGLAIHVGDRTGTAADYRLEDPEDVESFLEWLRDDGLEAVA